MIVGSWIWTSRQLRVICKCRTHQRLSSYKVWKISFNNVIENAPHPPLIFFFLGGGGAALFCYRLKTFHSFPLNYCKRINQKRYLCDILSVFKNTHGLVQMESKVSKQYCKFQFFVSYIVVIMKMGQAYPIIPFVHTAHRQTQRKQKSIMPYGNCTKNIYKHTFFMRFNWMQ